MLKLLLATKLMIFSVHAIVFTHFLNKNEEKITIGLRKKYKAAELNTYIVPQPYKKQIHKFYN